MTKLDSDHCLAPEIAHITEKLLTLPDSHGTL